MKTQTLFMTSLAATTLLATTPILAEDVTSTSPVDTITVPSDTKPVLPTQPSTDGSDAQENTSETPVTPDNPIDSSTGSQSDTKPVVPIEDPKEDNVSDDAKTEQEEPTQPEETPDDTSEDTPTPPVEVPTVDGDTTTIIPDLSVPTNNPKVTADTAQKAGASQVGTTSTVTGQVVQDVTATTPVQLATGATITDIRDGFVTLSTGAKVTPESVGVTQNSDGTYTAKTIQGDMVTLPHTGEKDNRVLVMLGALTALAGLLLAVGDRFKTLATTLKTKAH